MATITATCHNRECGFNLDAEGRFIGPSSVEISATVDHEGAAPPYGPPGGLREVLMPCEDEMICTECGEPLEL